jgi:hypothetical protein
MLRKQAPRIAWRLDASVLGQSFDDEGIGASIGLRAMASEKLELAGLVEYIELIDSGNDTSLRGEAWYNFTQNFAVGVNVGAAEDVVRYGIGARVYFGN